LRISAASDGTVWGINRGRWPVRLDKNKWKKVGKKRLLEIAVASKSEVWGIDEQNRIVKLQNGTFEVMMDKPAVVSLDAAPDGTVWYVAAAPSLLP
jgi:hypothetical protein